MKKEWLLLIAVSAVTIGVALAGIRYFAPQLLGIPIDLQSVQVSEEIPPFFENVFRSEDHNTGEFILKDPVSRVRGRALMRRSLVVGPHDLLGFRNHEIPNVVDIIVIGDSQTYGVNALLEANWPSQMKQSLKSDRTVYAMATGGWGAIQYLDMLSKSTVFKPELIIVAFYSGNDPSETFSLVYGSGVDNWEGFKVDPDTSGDDRPKFVGFPSPAEKNWLVEYSDGQKTEFTPELRLISNDTGYAVVRESWAIMEKIAGNMARIAISTQTKLIITMIPTKELAHLKRVRRDRIALDPVYEKLVRMEQENIGKLFDHVESLEGVISLDIIPDLQEAALGPNPLYPENSNGHPLAYGYQVVGNLIAGRVNAEYKKPDVALRKVASGGGGSPMYFLYKDNRLLLFASEKVATGNGWNLTDAKPILFRDFNKPIAGTINLIDSERFGPQ